jgi:hypothetical protein
MSTPTLEQRIAAAFDAADIKSAKLDALVQETEAAVIAADEAATKTREQALDPLISPDAAKARQSMEDAEFQRDRLRNVLPKLMERLREVQAQETYDRWVIDFEQIKPKHAAAVAKLKAVYLECEAKLVDAFMEAAAVDAEVQRVSSAKPYRLPQTNRDGRNLLTVEFAARGITGVGLYDHSIMKDLKLPSFSDPAKLAWPPHRPLDLAAIMAVLGGDDRVTPCRSHQ